MKGSKSASAVLTIAEKCKSILASNWEGKLATIKADAKGSKGDVHSSKVKYIVKKGKPYVCMPENDPHIVDTVIDERGSLAVKSPFPGPLARILKSMKRVRVCGLVRELHSEGSQHESATSTEIRSSLSISTLSNSRISRLDEDVCNCNSCWSLSAVHAIEGIVQIRTGKLEELSAQELMDSCACNADGSGDAEDAFKYVQEFGITSEKHYPYRAYKQDCQASNFPAIARISEFEKVPPDEKSLMKAVANQPVSAAITVPENLTPKVKGIFSMHTYEAPSHAITIVGYGEENGKKFWRIKNSYGPEWGEEGYFRLGRGVKHLTEGLCHIASHAWIPCIDIEGEDYVKFVEGSNRNIAYYIEQKRRFDLVSGVD
ncbi:hypothetical protein MLD38_008124 [Melastoma candidum]|uniref:Uncharacterized protein n=1 Tax=Melastoma candidum TaxID=119954 RepID=A0ACB9RSX2_9MYRT|nr:hypothetical protein MLD38_008124 [Melastoma candidum]